METETFFFCFDSVSQFQQQCVNKRRGKERKEAHKISYYYLNIPAATTYGTVRYALFTFSSARLGSPASAVSQTESTDRPTLKHLFNFIPPPPPHVLVYKSIGIRRSITVKLNKRRPSAPRSCTLQCWKKEREKSPFCCYSLCSYRQWEKEREREHSLRYLHQWPKPTPRGPMIERVKHWQVFLVSTYESNITRRLLLGYYSIDSSIHPCLSSHSNCTDQHSNDRFVSRQSSVTTLSTTEFLLFSKVE